MYGHRCLTRALDIPCNSVARRPTMDLKLSSGEQIPIDQRNPDKITRLGGRVFAPAGIHAANPAFDVTPHIYVTAIITEAGIARPPYDVSLRDLCMGYHTIGNFI